MFLPLLPLPEDKLAKVRDRSQDESPHIALPLKEEPVPAQRKEALPHAHPEVRARRRLLEEDASRADDVVEILANVGTDPGTYKVKFEHGRSLSYYLKRCALMGSVAKAKLRIFDKTNMAAGPLRMTYVVPKGAKLVAMHRDASPVGHLNPMAGDPPLDKQRVTAVPMGVVPAAVQPSPRKEEAVTVDDNGLEPV